MAFIETPRFPENLSYGSQGGPGFQTGIAVLQSGHEQRRGVWATPRHQYNASFAVKTTADVQAVRDFFQAMRGRLHGFRFKDWNDYTSAADGVSPHTKDDQTIGVGDSVETQFQLRKNYATGTEEMQRVINKPAAGGILVALDGVLQTDPTNYTYDSTTGLVTFVSAPGAAVVITAGYEFDVPCRFDLDVLNVTADTYGIRSTDIPIVELRI